MVGVEVGRMPGMIAGEQFVVRECSHCCIFLLDHLNTITVDDCSDCTIIIGPTSGSVFIRDCKSCVVVAACGQFRTRDCQELQLRLLCNTQPIIEASTRVRFSCYQLYYEQLQDQFRRSGLSVFNNNWSEVHDFTPGTDGDKNWSVVMPSVLPDLKLPSQSPFDCVGIECSRTTSVVPFTMGSVSPPSYRMLGDEPLLVIIYHCPQQGAIVKGVVRVLQEAAGLSAVLYTREVTISPTEAVRVLGEAAAGDAGALLTAGPVVALLVDAPYHHIQQSVSAVRRDLYFLSPNNGNGYNIANKFFSFASLSMSV
ncbi:protein XRP2 isoform X2 [Hyalella azteca]|nr:protein XRP2 isoform X2 [Hyalella azteca]